LTRAPIDRRLVVADLLDAAELAWLNNFHARVRADVIDLLEDEAAAWLLQATAPI
jgi:Xaa-Pro aminopeptidase